MLSRTLIINYFRFFQEYWIQQFCNSGCLVSFFFLVIQKIRELQHFWVWKRENFQNNSGGELLGREDGGGQCQRRQTQLLCLPAHPHFTLNLLRITLLLIGKEWLSPVYVWGAVFSRCVEQQKTILHIILLILSVLGLLFFGFFYQISPVNLSWNCNELRQINLTVIIQRFT